eukprot:scaffold200342_cov24-Attheya_sp.AAC.1
MSGGSGTTNTTGASEEEEIENAPLSAAKIVGTYSNYVNMMKMKNVSKGHSMPMDEPMIVLDSNNGAEHSTTAGKRLNVVLYSSQIFSGKTVAAGVTTAESFNILTWQQVIGEEKCAN